MSNEQESSSSSQNREWTFDRVCKILRDGELAEVLKTANGKDRDERSFQELTEPDLQRQSIPEPKRCTVLYLVDQLRKGPPVQYKVVNDPIHGHIKLHPLFVKIIDTPQFQRLRNLKQLGGCSYVYPGASHSRFEHCIGVCHLAGQLTEAIRDRQPELCITAQDVLCVSIAGLCHDLGHGPFSHVFDDKFMNAVDPDKGWSHEDASIKMFDHLVDDKLNDLWPEFKKYGLNEDDRTFIKEQISGNYDMQNQENSPKGRSKEKWFLYEIVANKRSGIDVDKWDYLARDCLYLGLNSIYDHRRFLEFTRVCRPEAEADQDRRDVMQICYRDKEVGNLYDMFYTRNDLHRRACKHKTVAIVEEMIAEALVEAKDYPFYKKDNGNEVKLSEAVDDMEAYTQLTDHIFQQILYSKDAGLAKSKKLLERIQKRELYKLVGKAKPAGNVELPRSLKERTKLGKEMVDAVSETELKNKGCTPPAAKDVIIQIVNMDYGMKNENPIDHVRFFTKGNPEEGIKRKRDQVSEKFCEQHILALSKKRDEKSLKAAELCFKKWCEQKGYELMSS